MQHAIPLVPSEDFTQIKRLIASGLTANLELAFQLLLSKHLNHWQAFSVIGYYASIQREYQDGYVGIDNFRLWQITLWGNRFEWIESIEFGVDVEPYLVINDKIYSIGTCYSKSMSVNITRREKQISRNIFVQFVYQKQEAIGQLFQKKAP
ncbi:MAG TPA: hypothetical protein DCS93_32915 [Microscillaceae bacterium]|nr:hypothetical protein [Microscillaceae bacterium]